MRSSLSDLVRVLSRSDYLETLPRLQRCQENLAVIGGSVFLLPSGTGVSIRQQSPSLFFVDHVDLLRDSISMTEMSKLVQLADLVREANIATGLNPASS